MLSIKECNRKTLEIEQSIMNSHPNFNFISTGHKELSIDEIYKDHVEQNKIEKERYLVYRADDAVGIIDFTMFNPNDECPWIGLFVVHEQYTKTDISHDMYKLLEDMMVNKGAKVIRLGCLKENNRGLSFWAKYNFKTYQEIDYEGRPMFCMEKRLGD